MSWLDWIFGALDSHGQRVKSYDEIADERRRRRVPKKLREVVMKRDGYKCQQCGSTYELQIDHIESVYNGGDSRPENLQVLCRECNTAKGKW